MTTLRGTTLTLGLLAVGLIGACSYEEKTVVQPVRTAEVVTPVAVAVSPAADACLTYGFTPGSVSYANCVDREREARRQARVAREYGEARTLSDARAACSGYGLSPGYASYDRCVSREYDLRRPL